MLAIFCPLTPLASWPPTISGPSRAPWSSPASTAWKGLMSQGSAARAAKRARRAQDAVGAQFKDLFQAAVQQMSRPSV
eukprot:5243185-Pyramimonas_sp.AAC.1